jgi:hypothetical protein
MLRSRCYNRHRKVKKIKKNKLKYFIHYKKMPAHSGNGKKMDKKTSGKKPAKGSKEMKEKMARLRAMKGKKGKK